MEKINIKYWIYSVLLTMSGLLTSCNSPNQPTDNKTNQVTNEPSVVTKKPVITIAGKDTALFLGDTLKFTLHVSAGSLMSGTIDFHDGTILVFNNISYVLDTTISHVFKYVEDYDVIISFNNGDDTSKIGYSVKVTYAILTLKSNKTILGLGDTLKIYLHTGGHFLSSGSIDFKDGTVINFSNLLRIFDTTIVHVYSQLGSYNIYAEFLGAGNSIVNIIVGRYYELSLAVGMEWQFLYRSSSESNNGSGYYLAQGIHDWKIISSSVINQDTIFTVQSVRSDTEYYSSNIPNFKNDTSQFTIVYSYNVIRFNPPLAGKSFFVPNHSYVTSYPVIVNGQNWYEYFLFEDDIGPTFYESSPINASFSSNTKLTLIKFVKP